MRIVPFYLLILWAAVLLSKSMVNSAEAQGIEQIIETLEDMLKKDAAVYTFIDKHHKEIFKGTKKYGSKNTEANLLHTIDLMQRQIAKFTTLFKAIRSHASKKRLRRLLRIGEGRDYNDNQKWRQEQKDFDAEIAAAIKAFAAAKKAKKLHKKAFAHKKKLFKKLHKLIAAMEANDDDARWERAQLLLDRQIFQRHEYERRRRRFKEVDGKK